MQERRLIRSATLKGYADAARAAGLEPAVMLGEVGLSLSLLDEPDRMISFDAFLKLLAISADRSGLADFGIRAAHARGIPDLGMVSLLMREADNVETAIRLYTSHLRLHADGTLIQLDTRFDDPLIAIELVGGNKRESLQTVQFCITGVLLQIRWLIGENYRPQLVCCSYPRPSDTRMTRRIFQCEVRYNQGWSGIVLDKAVLRRPLVTSPPFLRKLAMQQLEPLLKQGSDSFALKVKRIIAQHMDHNDLSAATIARELAIDRRTLTRRLAREGATYSSLLQAIRLHMAQQGLEDPGQSMTELSGSMGFQSLSAFSRWFQAAYGFSATRFRAMAARRTAAERPRPPVGVHAMRTL